MHEDEIFRPVLNSGIPLDKKGLKLTPTFGRPYIFTRHLKNSGQGGEREYGLIMVRNARGSSRILELVYFESLSILKRRL